MSSHSPPGPPPSSPPPPIPSSAPAYDQLARKHATQWPAHSKSPDVKNAAVWPVKAPPKPTVVPPAAPQATRRSTISTPDDARPLLSALSLNRLSFHRSHESRPTKPVQKPSSGRFNEKKASTASGSHAVQRRASGLERRVSGDRSHGSPSSRTPPRTPTVPTAQETSNPAPAPTLQKKRSLFKRVADKLTRSRTSLRDEYKARRASIHSVVPEVPSVPLRATTPEKSDPPARENPPPLPPTPTSTHTRKNRQPLLSINVHASGNSRNVLPSSPRPEAILAAMSRQTASLRQPLSPAALNRQPLSPASLTEPPSPATSARQRLSPIPSLPPSPVTSSRQSPNLLTRHSTTLRQPNPRQPSPARSTATGSSAATPAQPSHHGLSPKRTDRGRDDDQECERDQSRGQSRDGAHSPRRLPSTAEDEESEEEEERRKSEAKVSQWLTVPESPTTSSSLDHSHSHSQSSHSYSTGGRVSGKRFGGGFGGIDEEGGGIGFGDENMDTWRGAVTLNEDGEELLPEVERMALEAEERVRARGEGLANGTMVEKGGRKEGSLKKAGRQLRLFGKRTGKGEDGAGLDARPRIRVRPLAATTSDHASAVRRSLSFLSSSPGSPTTPVTPTMTLAPPTIGDPIATPRPRKPTANPTMHTRGSILLEAKEIEDPEIRRISEMVFLT